MRHDDIRKVLFNFRESRWQMRRLGSARPAANTMRHPAQPATLPNRFLPLTRIFPKMKLTMHRILPAFFLATALLPAIPEDVSGTTKAHRPAVTAQVGLDNSTRVGEWTPITVGFQSGTADSKGAIVEVVTVDPQGYPVTVSKPANEEMPVFVQFGRLETSLEVRLVDKNGNALATDRFTTAPDENGEPDFVVQRYSVPRWLVAGKLPAVDEVSRTNSSDSPLARVHITRRAAKNIPSDSLALASYDAILLSGAFGLTTEQAEAIDTWVKRGGQLVCFFGDKDRVKSFQASPLHGWFERIEILPKRVSDLSGVESFVQAGLDDGESAPLFIGARRVAVASVNLPGSVTLDKGGLSGSVLTETAHGFGRVTFAGFDMDRRPLSLWGEKGSGQFLLKLTGAVEEVEQSSRRGSRVSRSGVTDLATQFREANEYLPGQRDRSTLFVLGLVLLYLLIIGPADYFLVHRVLKKPQLTWLTFPAIVVVGALLARSAAQSANGTELRVTVADIVDIDATNPESSFVRESAWCSIFSPENARYRVALHSTGKVLRAKGAEPPASAKFKLGWFGMPEENYGGMYRSAGVELGNPGYQLSKSGNGVDNLPIPVWSNRSLRAETFRHVKRQFVVSDLKRSRTGGQLSSDSQFTHNLPVPIEDWLIVYGSRAYFPRDRNSENSPIRPREIWKPATQTCTSQDLASYLNGTSYRQVEEKTSTMTHSRVQTTLTDYDPQDRNLAGVLTMISFHKRSGGWGYTGLKNAALRQMELSQHLLLNRAVLIGRVRLPGSKLEVDGKPVEAERHDSLVRILMPVQATERSSILPKLED